MIPQIDSTVFARRRQQLMAKLPENSALILAGSELKNRNSDVDYYFRQESHFYYLTGFNEPDAFMVLLPGDQTEQYTLFCLDRDAELETWHGYRYGPQGCIEKFGADQAWPVCELNTQMTRLLDGKHQLYYLMGQYEKLDRQIQFWLKDVNRRARQGAKAPEKLIQLAPLLAEMRLFKSEEEQVVMRSVGEMSAQAHNRAMRYALAGRWEYQLEAEITHHFALSGCRQAAYPSIVGSGKNGCILHYTENNAQLTDGDLVLIDAGAEMDYYAADITRTFPVNGRFSKEQKAIYELVLKTQLACLDICVPGTLWDDVNQLAILELTTGLVDLGLLEGNVAELIADEAYKPFYMHRVGHWLGLDVHDVGHYKIDGQWRALQPGMVMTVEPGLYIAADNLSVDERWRGIGVRIEDNVLITAHGHEILTSAAVKGVAEIEALMAQNDEATL